MNRVLKLQSQLQGKPFGMKLFSYLLARAAPYCITIRPQVKVLRVNYMEASMKKRRAVHNHLKTVHAIAVCNLCEFTAGVCMEASAPKNRRWIPIGMQVNYLKKAKTDLTAACDLDGTDWVNCNEVLCVVSVKDTNGVEVVAATITMKVSDKKTSKTSLI